MGGSGRLRALVLNQKRSVLADLFNWTRPLSTGAHSTGTQDGNPAPVVIAGAGPSGLVLALQLAKYGIRSVVMDRAQEVTKHPQAHFINNRTMEIFRHLDGLAAEVTGLSPPLEQWRRFVYCRSVAGELLGDVDHFAGQSGPGNPAISPEALAHLPQSRLLPLLMRRAESQPLIQLHLGCNVTGVKQSPQGVEVETVNQRQQRQVFKGAFLAAADGAHSTIRKALGIPMEGEPAMQHLINIHFFSPRLGQLAAARPGMLYFVFNAEVVAVLVAHTIDEGEFVAQVPFFPPLQSLEDFSQETCQAIVRAAAGVPDLSDISIRQVKSWTMSALVASRFSDGRVFLLGDAAHRFPPAGGFGMNTGIQDAHNLAWKLAAVLQGWAHMRLLDTYELERKPIAQANTSLSVANWKEAIRLPQALGLDPRAANIVSSLVAAVLPKQLGKGVLQGALGFGKALAATPLGPVEPWRKQALSRILASGETLRLQFPKEDLGFVYGSGALLLEDTSMSCDAGSSMRGAPYVPSSAPGCRLPHCWLFSEGHSPHIFLAANSSMHGSTSSGGQVMGHCVSTLDLVAQVGSSMLLVLVASDEAQLHGLQRAAAEVLEAAAAAQPHIPLSVVRVLLRDSVATGGDIASSSGSRQPSSAEPANPLLAEKREWQAAMGARTQALLVRPDGHVACRWEAGATGSFARRLAAALKTVQGTST